MADQPLLSELCSICYTNKPKYRCPRCKAHTCSLPCYKRHQQRASCTGKRDPAEYLKKSQLATPAGIDRDYNYLKNVERTLDHAARDNAERGIQDRIVSKYVYKASLPDGKVQRYLDLHRITVNRAPKGMSRQKTNHTRSTKRDNILWTIEWIHEDGTKDVQDDCFSTSSLEDIYNLLQTQKKHVAQRQQVDSEANAADLIAGKKRKRKDVPEDSSAKTAPVKVPPLNAVSETLTEKSTNDEVNNEDDHQQSDKGEGGRHTVYGPGDEDYSDTKTVPELPPDSSSPPSSPNPASKPEQPLEEPSDPSHPEEEQQQHHFYLHLPTLPSAQKVLLPLSPTSTLTQSLTNQTIQEYPTIYILPGDPTSLPAQFTTQTAFQSVRTAEDEELHAAIKETEVERKAFGKGVLTGANSVGRGVERGAARKEAEEKEGDRKRILGLLRRDLAR